jgi:uncharacterized protein (DUF924 family)
LAALRHFFYMPLMYAESPSLQQISRERFARFPMRNAALGRASSAEEEAFLQSATPR